MRSARPGEGDREQREGRRRGEGGADALDGAGGEQQPAGLGEPAGERSDREQGEAREEDAATAEQVAAAGAEQQQAAEGQAVGVETHDSEVGLKLERALDVGQRDVHDAGVEHDHELGDEDDRERGPGAAGTQRR